MALPTQLLRWPQYIGKGCPCDVLNQIRAAVGPGPVPFIGHHRSMASAMRESNHGRVSRWARSKDRNGAYPVIPSAGCEPGTGRNSAPTPQEEGWDQGCFQGYSVQHWPGLKRGQLTRGFPIEFKSLPGLIHPQCWNMLVIVGGENLFFSGQPVKNTDPGELPCL